MIKLTLIRNKFSTRDCDDVYINTEHVCSIAPYVENIDDVFTQVTYVDLVSQSGYKVVETVKEVMEKINEQDS